MKIGLTILLLILFLQGFPQKDTLHKQAPLLTTGGHSVMRLGFAV